jgi:predicted AAA+ superfamily ATPase
MNIPKDLQIRNKYLTKVKPFINQNLIKVFTGQRRVGKSYMLFQIMDYIQEQNVNNSINIIYINKEDLAFSFIKNAIDLNDYVLAKLENDKQNYVFIDEIQDILNFEEALRSLLLKNNLDLYCTGSNANLLSGDIAGNLSGRFIEINVYSLSYIEFLEFHQLQQSQKSLNKYFKYGGLPYLKHLDLKDEIVFEYLKNIYSTIVYRDIINRYSIRSTRFLEQLVQFLASNIGSIFSSKKISDFLKSQKVNISPYQVQTYIDYLISAFLVQRAERYDIKGKHIFEFGDKFFFENIGIRNGIVGYTIADRSKIMENVVYNHLIANDFKVKVGVLGNKEIDFVASKNGESIYIQVALSIHSETTLEREFGNLLAIKDQYPKYVITMEQFDGATYQGIHNLSLQQFLMQSKF